jgi:hypothetical protein
MAFDLILTLFDLAVNKIIPRRKAGAGFAISMLLLTLLAVERE